MKYNSNTEIAKFLKSEAGPDLEIRSGNTAALIFDGANVAAQGNVTVNGDIVGDANEAKAIFAATTSNTITIGGTGSTVATAGELTVTGAKIIVGSDANGSNKTMTFGHGEVKTIMGVYDDDDVFAIHTDADFTGNNDIEIDGDGAVRFNGAVTFAGGIASGGTVTTTDIDGGSIDGTVIGAATQAAGDFTAIGAVTPGTIVGTTVTANTSLLPGAVGGADIGSATAEWGDAYIADDNRMFYDVTTFVRDLNSWARGFEMYQTLLGIPNLAAYGGIGNVPVGPLIQLPAKNAAAMRIRNKVMAFGILRLRAGFTKSILPLTH